MSWNEIARTEWKEQPHLLILPQKWFLSPFSSYLPPSDKWPSATHRCPCVPLLGRMVERSGVQQEGR